MHLDLTERDFKKFSDLIYQKCGINIHEGKKELLKARLAKVLRKSKFQSPRAYYDFLVKKATADDFIPLLDSISTNLTYFFREPRHFDFLSKSIAPELSRQQKNKARKKVDVWCAACSSGEEPYSIAITLMESLPDPIQWEVSILATDISTKVLNLAQQGIYEKERIKKIPYPWLRRYFQKGNNKWHGYFRVKSEIRSLVRFERVNLIEPLPFKQAFDLVFSRNVMIYFDKTTQERVINKFHDGLKHSGYLFVGHSESLIGIDHRFKYIQPSVYRKC